MGIMDENNPLMLEILNHIIYLSTRFQKVFISQGTLAAKFNTSREWVNKLLARWKALGVIKYRQQDFNRSCIYFLHPLLNQEKNRIKFKLPAAMLLFSISSLCSAAFEQPFTLSNNKNLSIWKMVTVQAIDHGFYIPREAEAIVFLKNRQQTAINTAITSKERVMEDTISQLAAAFYLNEEQAEQYSNQYSKSVLQKALQSFQKQRTQRVINNPKAWLARVLADEERKEQEKAQHSSNGKQAGHSTNPRNPNGHSPAQELPNLTHMEQIEYLVKEIFKFSKTFDPNKVYSRDPGLDEHLKKIAMNSIAGMQREVDQLLAQLDDPNHHCKIGCVDQSLFFRKQKQQADVDFTQQSADKDYEEHLNAISADKSDSAGYKELVRKYDYRRIAR